MGNVRVTRLGLPFPVRCFKSPISLTMKALFLFASLLSKTKLSFFKFKTSVTRPPVKNKVEIRALSRSLKNC